MNSAALIRLVSPGGPKYRRLCEYLTAQPPNLNELEIEFGRVIVIISNQLPKSAWLYRAWWANDKTHTQAAAWLGAGWKTEKVRMTERLVSFVRIGLEE